MKPSAIRAQVTFPNAGALEGALARRRTRAPKASGGPQSRGPCEPVRRCPEPRHEKGEVDAARDVAFQDGITHVPAPHGQALTLALLKVAAAYDDHRVSLAKIRRAASTWSSRSAKRARRASGPKTFTRVLSFSEYTSWPSRVMCHPHEKMRRAPGGASSSTAWVVPVEYPWTPRGASRREPRRIPRQRA